MKLLSQTYRKLTRLVTVSLFVFTGIYVTSAQDEASPLLTLLANAPQTPAYSQMTANVVRYANYRALEAAAGLQPIDDREAYRALDDETQAAWATSLLRIHAGPRSFVNIAGQRIEQMPRLLGFGFFDVDAGLVYGGDPFTGTLLYSADGAFDPARTAAALIPRGYTPRTVATGGAWGLGGDGMTDINNLEMGDPFGGDVGLSSRVAVFSDNVLINSFVWPIVFIAAEAHTGLQPSYADDLAYVAMADLLERDAPLLQTVMLNREAGAAQTTDEDVDTIPPYELAAIADLDGGEAQINRMALLYVDEADADDAAAILEDAVRAFDSGWFQTLGYETDGAFVISVDDYYAVVLDWTAPAPPPEEVAAGAFEPGLVFGFWVTALDQGTFFPLAFNPQ